MLKCQQCHGEVCCEAHRSAFDGNDEDPSDPNSFDPLCGPHLSVANFTVRCIAVKNSAPVIPASELARVASAHGRRPSTQARTKRITLTRPHPGGDRARYSLAICAPASDITRSRRGGLSLAWVRWPQRGAAVVALEIEELAQVGSRPEQVVRYWGVSCRQPLNEGCEGALTGRS